MNPKGYRCANCGNMLPASRTGIIKCECCGSEYRIEDGMEPLRIERIPFQAVTLGCEAIIPREILLENPNAAFEITLNRMARNLAEKLVPVMDLTVRVDPLRADYLLQARLRAAIPPVHPKDVLREAVKVDAEGVDAKKVEGMA